MSDIFITIKMNLKELFLIFKFFISFLVLLSNETIGNIISIDLKQLFV